jgi:dolichyl-phosphate-mannose-protein mannosyltransferase
MARTSQGKANGHNKARSRTPPKKSDDYSSDGVEDNDVFLLPVSDYQVVLGVTIVAAIVRLFRIYQPTSVVFDEVQYV